MRQFANCCTVFAIVLATLMLKDVWDNEERHLFWLSCSMIASGILLCAPWLFYPMYRDRQ
jgi:type VI protein secretion system component VasK